MSIRSERWSASAASARTMLAAQLISDAGRRFHRCGGTKRGSSSLTRNPPRIPVDMRFARRQLRKLASVILGVWVVALFVGTAFACSTPPSPSLAPVHADSHIDRSGYPTEDSRSPACVKLCGEDTPLPSKSPLIADQSAGQPLLLSTSHVLTHDVRGTLPASAPFARPPPGVPIYLRSLRFAL